MSGDCETSGSCGCESESSGSCGAERGCPCGSKGCSGEAADCAEGMWTGSFFQALKQAQVDLLKAKIQKAWGPKMDKVADAVLEAMGAQWQAMMAQSKSKETLRERLGAIWQEGQR